MRHQVYSVLRAFAHLIAISAFFVLSLPFEAHADVTLEERPVLPARSKQVYIEWRDRISAVSEDGTILLERGWSVKQWAVNFTNMPATREFLVGREIVCREVVSELSSNDLVDFEGYIGVYDCEVLSKTPQPPQIERGGLSLYPWAEDLGLGQIGCEDADKMPKGIRGVYHANGYFYSCNGDVSERQLPVP